MGVRIVRKQYLLERREWWDSPAHIPAFHFLSPTPMSLILDPSKNSYSLGASLRG